MRRCKLFFRPSLGGRLAGLGCACALAAMLTACHGDHGAAASNASAGGNIAQAAQPSGPANASQGGQPPADVNVADLVNSTETIDERARMSVMLAQKNTDCVDQLIKSQPFGETRTQIIDNVTKACLPIAMALAQSSLSPPANVEQSEHAFVADQAHDLIDEAAPSGAAQQPVQPPPHPPTNAAAPPPSNATRG